MLGNQPASRRTGKVSNIRFPCPIERLRLALAYLNTDHILFMALKAVLNALHINWDRPLLML